MHSFFFDASGFPNPSLQILHLPAGDGPTLLRSSDAPDDIGACRLLQRGQLDRVEVLGQVLQVCAALPCPALPCPAPPRPALPCPAQPCPALPWPAPLCKLERHQPLLWSFKQSIQTAVAKDDCDRQAHPIACIWLESPLSQATCTLLAQLWQMQQHCHCVFV